MATTHALPHCTQRQPRLIRSEEHTSELQSRPHLVCRLLLEKKNPHLALSFFVAVMAQKTLSSLLRWDSRSCTRLVSPQPGGRSHRASKPAPRERRDAVALPC